MGVREFVRTVRERVGPERIRPSHPPQAFTDDAGREIAVRAYHKEDRAQLVEMYDDFAPEQRAQGVPPLSEPAIREWLDTILDGPDVVACHGDRVVGHVSFVPDDTGRHELAIFVHQEYQGAGIGTRLLSAGMGHAQAEGTEYVWLSVGKSERKLQRLYSRAGFSVVNPMSITHRMSRYL
ncbi:GNAT family N-acetyltransferase [Halovenus salina]|uniref:GNAT family N-acetyltransferase n=1 Tax=Halovenus salina TaxID=1510225 RepID=A0ABD5W5R8_9EURY|nr:GNAT family N-acetyltransferase [Halovenus salina]